MDGFIPDADVAVKYARTAGGKVSTQTSARVQRATTQSEDRAKQSRYENTRRASTVVIYGNYRQMSGGVVASREDLFIEITVQGTSKVD